MRNVAENTILQGQLRYWRSVPGEVFQVGREAGGLIECRGPEIQEHYTKRVLEELSRPLALQTGVTVQDPHTLRRHVLRMVLFQGKTPWDGQRGQPLSAFKNWQELCTRK